MPCDLCVCFECMCAHRKICTPSSVSCRGRDLVFIWGINLDDRPGSGIEPRLLGDKNHIPAHCPWLLLIRPPDVSREGLKFYP